MIEVVEADINCEDAVMLIGELNQILKEITGASGAKSFKLDDMRNDRSVFMIAYIDGKPYGCGALKEVSDHVAEIKRVYARPNQAGVGHAILEALERKAESFDYAKLILETRRINKRAVHFYEKHGYHVCDNFGKYIGRSEAVCFQKCR